MHNALKDNPQFALLGIGGGGQMTRDSLAKQKQLASGNGWHWTKLHDASDRVFQDYGIQYFPTVMLVDPAGDIVATDIGTIKATLSSELGVDLGAAGGAGHQHHGAGGGSVDSGSMTFRIILIAIIVVGFIIVIATRNKSS